MHLSVFETSVIRVSTLAVALAIASTAQAQMGSGWTQYSPPKFIQFGGSSGYHSYASSKTSVSESGASYTRANGVETFEIRSGANNRVEIRVQDEYTSGQRQFQGEVMVKSPTTAKSVMQVFHVILIKTYNTSGGSLTGEKYANGTLATGVYGKWVRINTTHNASTGSLQIYINGTQKDSVSVPKEQCYTKYGIYGSYVAGREDVQWRNVKFYRK